MKSTLLAMLLLVLSGVLTASAAAGTVELPPALPIRNQFPHQNPIVGLAIGVSSACAVEIHVATTGSDTNPGTKRAPFRTIQRAADVAQPGDTITVHEGIYREHINPLRGGTSDRKRIVYQAAPGEKVTITGAEPLKGWVKVGGDTWKVIVPNAYFGDFNPFRHRIQGEWCSPTGRHAGSVYLNGDWLAESLALEPVLKPAGTSPLWFAEVGGDAKDDGKHLFAITLLIKPREWLFLTRKRAQKCPIPSSARSVAL